MTAVPQFRAGLRLILVALIVSSCGDLPHDSRGTLEAARGGVLRVGVTAAPPWVTRSGGTDAPSDRPGGVEAELIRSFAAGIGAEVQWVWGGPEENLMRLERGELAVVAAGLTRATPWKARVGLTRPHTESGGEKHVLATTPGENRLLVALERHIEREATGGRERQGREGR